jgi:hypothetical protein
MIGGHFFGSNQAAFCEIINRYYCSLLRADGPPCFRVYSDVSKLCIITLLHKTAIMIVVYDGHLNANSPDLGRTLFF